jgi:hypothetical protein
MIRYCTVDVSDELADVIVNDVPTDFAEMNRAPAVAPSVFSLTLMSCRARLSP